MKTEPLWRILLLGLGLTFSGYYIYHPGEDLTKPEVFWPSSKGDRPGPGKPMKQVWIVLDQRLAKVSNNESKAIEAISSWGSISGTSVRVSYGGRTKFSGDWSQRLSWKDGRNGVELVKQDWFFGPTLVALTVLFYHPETSKLSEADIFFNGEDWSFGDLTEPGSYNADFANIFTHELGHFLGLGHSQVKKATMSYFTAPWETKRRTLDSDDEKGIRYLYPRYRRDLPGPSIWKLEKADCQWQWNYEHDKLVVSQSSGTIGICLYGAGFRGDFFQISLISEEGEKKSPISNLERLSENLIHFDLDLSQLSPGNYQIKVKLKDGKVGTKKSALLVQ